MKQLLIILTLAPLSTFCQGLDTIQNKKFSIGLSISPDYTYRTLKTDASLQWLVDSRNNIEIPKFGYTAGPIFGYDFYKRLSFEVGFLFSDKGEKTKPIELHPNDPDPIIPPGTSITIFFHYYYLDIPIKVNYYFITTRKGGFFVSASFSPNIFLWQDEASIFEYITGRKQIKEHSDGNYSKVNLSFTAGFGYQRNFSNKLFFKIQPVYRRSITSIIDAPIKGFLYSVGLDFGLYYKI